MTDETTGREGESNPQDGVTFVSETIIKKAPAASAPAPSSLSPRSIPVENAPALVSQKTPAQIPDALKPPLRVMPDVVPLMRDIPPPKPITPKAPPTPAAPIPAPTSIPEKPLVVELTPSMPPAQKSEPAPATPTIVEPKKEPEPVVPPSPISTFTPHMQADMQKILSGVKLPERNIPAAPPKQIPTLPTDIPPTPPTVPLPETAPLAEKVSAEGPRAQTPDNTNERTIVSVHTLKDDLQHVVRDKKISYVRAVALEEEKKAKRAGSEDALPRRSSWVSRTIFTIVILFALGGAALGAVLFIENQKSAQAPTLNTSSVMFAEQTVTFPLGNTPPADVKRALAEARARGTFTLGAITRVMPTISEGDIDAGTLSERQATFAEFLSHIGARPPEELARAVSSEFFFGIHTVDENAPVIVVPVTSYENAFAAMLAWEKTMSAELQPIFTPLPPYELSPEGLPVERAFRDTLMRNYDVRAMKDDAGAIQLFYSFPTRNILIIAESPYSFTEALSRLRAERKL